MKSKKVIDLKLTYQCNNDCIYCCQERELRYKETFLTTTKINDFLQNSNIKYDKAVLTGGEPTLNSELIQIVTLLTKYHIPEIQLQTNGRLLSNMEYLHKLIKNGVNSFGISLHGHNEKIHEAFTGTNNSFNEVILGLENLKKFNLPVTLNCVITKHNIDFLKNIIDFVLKRKYCNQIQFAFIHITGKAKNKTSDFVRITDVANKIKEVIDLYKDKIVILTEAIPLCLMYKHEKNVAELYSIFDTTVLDFRSTINFTSEMKRNFKAKGIDCNKCIFFEICDGPWIEYPTIYGYDEFKPVYYFRSEY